MPELSHWLARLYGDIKQAGRLLLLLLLPRKVMLNRHTQTYLL